MHERAICGLLLVVGVIHLLPVSGVLGTGQLRTLYGIEPADVTVVILMRHRAVLFGILGAFVAYAAFRPELRPAAFAVAAASIGSFLWLALSAEASGEAIRRIVVADLIAGVALLGAVVLHALGGDP